MENDPLKIAIQALEANFGGQVSEFSGQVQVLVAPDQLVAAATA